MMNIFKRKKKQDVVEVSRRMLDKEIEKERMTSETALINLTIDLLRSHSKRFKLHGDHIYFGDGFDSSTTVAIDDCGQIVMPYYVRLTDGEQKLIDKLSRRVFDELRMVEINKIKLK